MENKYYTPNIEEFRIGFEYEVYIPEKELWSTETFYLNNSHIDVIKYVNIQTENTLRKVRVKYLDKSDIESLGFEKSPDEPEEWFWNYKGDFNIQLYFNDKIENLDRGIGISMYNDSLVFSGYIKNKSELQQVLKMIGVIE